MPQGQGRDPLRRRRGLDGDSRLRHGAPERAAQLRPRSRRVSGLRLGHGDRPHRHAQIRHAGSAAVLRSGRALARPLRLPPARPADPGGRIVAVSPSSLPAQYRALRRFSFGDSPALADELLALVLAGRKTATCTTPDDPNLSRPGEQWIVLDGRGRPACVIETVEITMRRYEKVDAAFAY